MTSPQAAKGANFERAVTRYLRDQLGEPVVHRLRGEGIHDRGDLQIGDAWTLELKCYPTDPQRAIRVGLTDLTAEQARAGCPYGAVIVKRPGTTDPGDSLVVCTLRDWLQVARETL